MANGAGQADPVRSSGGSDHLPTLIAPTPAAHGPRFEPGALIAGRYRVVRFLAEGGMGEVYEVEDVELHENVALKTIRASAMRGNEAVERFKREIQLARQVTHPNVCRIFEFGIHREVGSADVLFLTMELLSGETLSHRIAAAGRLTTAAAAKITEQIASALATAHEAGIVHRDFKSSNVMLVPGKSGERAVVTDFGLARSMGQGSQAVTISGEVLGTPAYMAPEQLSGGAIGPPTDIYALGIVLYEMVTGRLPFSGDTPFAVALQRLQSRPVAPRKVNPELEARWERVILRCLEREPADRYQSANEVARAIAGEAGARSPKSRRRLLRLTAAAAVLALLGGAAWWAVGRWSAAVAPSGDAAAVAPGEHRKSVAVLGFANLAQKPESAWLSTAFAEMLRADLGAGGQLRTVAGESVSRMKVELGLVDTATLAGDTLARVRQILGAEFVVLGSYLASADGAVVLNFALQDASSGEVVETGSIPGGQADLFAVVSRAGDRMRTRLGAEATQGEAAERVRSILPADPDAARLYAEGLERLRAFDAVAAKELLTQGVVAAPEHALLHAAHGEAWAALGYDATARKELQRAAELAGPLPKEERLAIEARQYELDGRFDQALLNRRALRVFSPDDLDVGLRLAMTLVASRPAEALATLEELRKLPPPAGEDPRIDLAAAAAAKAMTDWNAMEIAAAKAARIARSSGARLLAAQALLAQCDARVKLDRLAEATPLCDEARELFLAAKDGGSVARVENVLGVAQAMQGEGAAARAAFQRSLAAFRTAGDRRGTQVQLNNIGNTYADEGDLAAAEVRYVEALALARETGDRDAEARTLNNLGSLRWEASPRRAREALGFYNQALSIYRELDAAANVARALYNVAEAKQELGDLPAARADWTEAVAFARQSDDKVDLADSLRGLAGCELALGSFSEALAAAGEARRLYAGLEDKGGERQAGALQATSLERLGRRDEPAAARAALPPEGD